LGPNEIQAFAYSSYPFERFASWSGNCMLSATLVFAALLALNGGDGGQEFAKTSVHLWNG